MNILMPDEEGENVNYKLHNTWEVKSPKATKQYFLKSYINYYIVEQSSTQH